MLPWKAIVESQPLLYLYLLRTATDLCLQGGTACRCRVTAFNEVSTWLTCHGSLQYFRCLAEPESKSKCVSPCRLEKAFQERLATCCCLRSFHLRLQSLL